MDGLSNGRHQVQEQHVYAHPAGVDQLAPHFTSFQGMPVPQPPSSSTLDLVEESNLADKYAAELPTILNDLVPLPFIVERVVAQAHADLANLAETLPHSPDQAKKRAIVDYVLQTRRQILKLLVLVRWSSQAESVAKCMNIIGFLSRQNYEFDHTISSLTEVKAMLASARVRNYDLTTALDVLTNGNWTRLPSCIAEGFSQPERLDDETVLQTLTELDDILRWRLACVEHVPRRMRERYWIADGRATFHVPGMWEASFTYGGDDTDNPVAHQWFLLSLRFLFRVKDSRGAWSDVPDGPIKEHIVELCNRELARRKAPPEGSDQKQEDAQFAANDTPLVRGYNFLQRLALSYQIEAVYAQAVQLASSTWNGHLRIEMSKDRQQVKLSYWAPTKADPPLPQRNTSVPQPIPPPAPCLTFSIQSRTSAFKPSLLGSSPTRTRRSALGKALDAVRGRVAATNSAVTDADTDLESDACLDIEWIASSLTVEAQAEVALDLGTDLDLSHLVRRVTSVHAREATFQIYHQLLTEIDVKDLELVSSADSQQYAVPVIRVHLTGAHYVTASVNPLTGRFEFRAEGEVSSVREARLRNAADKVDKDRKTCGDTLLRVRASTIVDEVDSRAAYLGLQTSRRLPFRSVELARLGTNSRSFLFVHLSPPLPSSSSFGSGSGPSISSSRASTAGPPTSYYLTLILAEHGFKFALVSAREASDQMSSWLGIDEIGWLKRGDLGRIGGVEGGNEARWQPTEATTEDEGTASFEVSIEDLKNLHSYCVRRIAFFKIERQLPDRRIPFRVVSSATAPSSSATTNAGAATHGTPYLVVQSSDLFRDAGRIAYPNIAILCRLPQDQEVGTAGGGHSSTSGMERPAIQTSFHVRLRRLPPALVESLSKSLLQQGPNAASPASITSQTPSRTDNVLWNPKTHILTFVLNAPDQLDVCVEVFLRAYAVVVKNIVIARHRESTEAVTAAAAAATEADATSKGVGQTKK